VQRIHTVVLLAAFALLSGASFGQVATGTPPFGSFGGGPFDTINLGNLNVHFAVPVLNKAGRGTSFHYSLGYDSSVWYPVTSNGVTSWTYLSNWGWTAQSNALGGSVTEQTFTATCVDPGPPRVTYHPTGTKVVSFTDPLGVAHRTFLLLDPCQTGNVFSGTTTDGSGSLLSKLRFEN
jgi:hypothetical protein